MVKWGCREVCRFQSRDQVTGHEDHTVGSSEQCRARVEAAFLSDKERPIAGRRVELVPAPWVPEVPAGGGDHRALGGPGGAPPGFEACGLLRSAPRISVLRCSPCQAPACQPPRGHAGRPTLLSGQSAEATCWGWASTACSVGVPGRPPSALGFTGDFIPHATPSAVRCSFHGNV